MITDNKNKKTDNIDQSNQNKPINIKVNNAKQSNQELNINRSNTNQQKGERARKKGVNLKKYVKTLAVKEWKKKK